MSEIDLSKICDDPDQMDIICRLADMAVRLAQDIALGDLFHDHGAEMGVNKDGDGQKALDVIADEYFAQALKGSQVRFYASEEQENVIALNAVGSYGLAIDPLDGSSNIGINIPLGTIFSLVRIDENSNDLTMAEANFLKPGRKQQAAGYFIYGSQIALVVSFGHGTHQFIYDQERHIFCYSGALLVKPETTTFAINASNYRHWPSPVRTYIDDCLAGDTGTRQKNFNMRWIASLVAETHRIFHQSGVFLYPCDQREGYQNGRLRMIYECAPIAMLIENAGGAASNGTAAILDQAASTLHERTPFIFGAKAEIEYILKPLNS